MKVFLLICLLISTAYSITPSPDFNLTDFIGNWTYAGFYSVTTQNIAYYSCAQFYVSQGALSVLTLTETWIDNTTNLLVTQVQKVLPSPLNNAILISTTTPTALNNYVVAYYNTTTQSAVLINQAATKAFLLTRNDSLIAQQEFFPIAAHYLTLAGISPNSVIPIYGYNCDYGKLQPLANFDLTLLFGNTYYANVMYSEQEFYNPICAILNFTQVGSFLSLNFTQNGQTSSETVLPYPGLPALWIDTEVTYLNPLTVTYQDTENNAFLVFREPLAMGFSTKTSMNPLIVSNIMKSLESQGFSVNTLNFLIIPKSCYPSDDEEERTFLSV